MNQILKEWFMAERLQLDDRLYNPYAVEDLATSHPEIFAALKKWFAALGDFDDDSLIRLLGARNEAEAVKYRAKGEQALAQLPLVLTVLDELSVALDGAVAKEAAGSAGHARLTGLATAARQNRTELGRAPELVQKVLSLAANLAPAVQGGEQAVEAAAKKLEALAAASAVGVKSFSELSPFIQQLQQVWRDLDAALKDLPRPEARRLRGAQHARMQAAAGRITANLLTAKQRDRAAGRLSSPEFTLHEDRVADRFAHAIVRGDYDGAAALLAPWMRAPWAPATLREKVEGEYANVAAQWADQLGGAQLPPGDYRVSNNPLGLKELRGIQSGSWGSIPAEITEENFGGWVLFNILTSEEDAYLTDLENLLSGYLIPVNTADGDRIGFLAFGEG
jgi:hypothetical protein